MKIGDIELRPLQIEAVEKFKNVRSVLLGDDTGTGKTVTCLALVQQIWDLGEVGPVLIVTKSFDVWTEHLSRMGYESSRIHVIDKKNRSEFIQQVGMIERNPTKLHFYIMHYEALPLKDMVGLFRIKWLVVVADEMHKIKNRKAMRTVAMKKLKTVFKIGATATPGDNLAPDIWSLLNWLYPKVYTSYWRWVRYYIECEDSFRGYTVFRGPIEERIPEFLEEIKPFYISRTLDEVDSSVPKMVYSSTEVDMSWQQEQAYREIVEQQMAYLGDDLLIASTQLEASMRMHQLANSFGRLEVGWKWKKELVNGVEVRVKVPKFSVRLEEPSTKLDQLDHILAGKCFTITSGEGPVEYLIDYKHQLYKIPIDEPIVIFTTYVDMVTMACKRMDELGVKYVAVTGGTELTADQAADIFQRGSVRVFIGTAQTIGESITLTRSHIEIYIDVHWSPRVKKQCDGRIRRIGQTQTPWAIDIKTRNSVDYAKLDTVRTKAEWLDAMFGRIKDKDRPDDNDNQSTATESDSTR